VRSGRLLAVDAEAVVTAEGTMLQSHVAVPARVSLIGVCGALTGLSAMSSGVAHKESRRKDCGSAGAAMLARAVRAEGKYVYTGSVKSWDWGSTCGSWNIMCENSYPELGEDTSRKTGVVIAKQKSS
jgi:hypothetical protein